jgi:hypothetical protein
MLQDISASGVARVTVTLRPNRGFPRGPRLRLISPRIALSDQGTRGQRLRKKENAGREKVDALVPAA